MTDNYVNYFMLTLVFDPLVFFIIFNYFTISGVKIPHFTLNVVFAAIPSCACLWVIYIYLLPDFVQLTESTSAPQPFFFGQNQMLPSAEPVQIHILSIMSLPPPLDIDRQKTKPLSRATPPCIQHRSRQQPVFSAA